MRRTFIHRLLTLGSLCVAVPAIAQQGALELTDAKLDTAEHFDVHTFDGTAGSVITIGLTSNEFDVYLIVLNPDDTILTEVDDSDGHGYDVQTSFTLPSTGRYPVIVTSAFPGETGTYILTMSSAAATDGTFSGAFTDGRLTVTLQGTGSSYTGQLTLGGEDYPATAQADGSTLAGTFQSGGSSFGFSATLAGEMLTLESGGVTYVLTRQRSGSQPTNPLVDDPRGLLPAPEVIPAPAPAAPPADPVQPVPRMQPRPGYVTGTVFDTQGQPLPAAGVLITGTTFEQGQRTSFDAVTDANGTYSVRVPDGRYEAKAWIDVTFDGAFFSRLLHPLSGSAHTAVDSTEGGNLDFQWRLSGLTPSSTPPGRDPTDFYGASIDLSYCGLPASAYCSAAYSSFPAVVAPAGSTVRLTLTPSGPLIDGSQGHVLTYDIPVAAQLPDYPHGTAVNRLPDYPDGGGGRLVLGADWAYSSADFNDIPLGIYLMTATAILPNGAAHAMTIGLDAEDVNHRSIRIAFSPWDSYQARSYSGGGITQLTVYIRD